MIQIILILLFLHYMGLLLFKPKSDRLYCGLIGWTGKNPEKFNKAKFDILGLYNNSRGGDSCGVSTDGEIYYGLKETKNYEKFIVEKDYLKPKVIPTVIGHTRRLSLGVANEDNAHPFGYGKYKEGFKFIFAHNGTLYNHEDLAKEYDIDHRLGKINEYNIDVLDRYKNDSEILGECIYKSKSIKILDKYIGGAAILFQDLAKPNIMYAFHGASRKETTDENPQKFEERPLYYYKETRNSLYISSMPEALVAIGGIIGKTVFEFDFNKVYEIKDGDIDNAVHFKVDRNNAAQKKGYSFENFHNGHSKKTKNGMATAASYPNLNKWERTRNRGTKKSKKYKQVDNNLITNIYDETSDNLFKSGINFQHLRYQRNGHPITGIYTHILNYGFYPLREKANEALARAYELMNKPFDIEKGIFLDSNLSPDFKSGNIIIPFPFKNNEPPMFYFFEGIRLQKLLDYEALIGKFTKFSFHDISEMATHPIIDLKSGRKPDGNQQIILNRKEYSGKYSFIQSGKIYDIFNGNLIFIEEAETSIDEIPVILLPPSSRLAKINTCSIGNVFGRRQKKEMKDLEDKLFNTEDTRKEYFLDTSDPNGDWKIKAIEDTEEIMKDLENEDPEIEIVNDDETNTLVNNIMLPVYLKVQEVNNDLLKEKDNPIINEIIDINKDYLLNLNDMVIDKPTKNS